MVFPMYRSPSFSALRSVLPALFLVTLVWVTVGCERAAPPAESPAAVSPPAASGKAVSSGSAETPKAESPAEIEVEIEI